jgi:hypothetical protein
MAVTSTASRETPVSSRRANPVHAPASANDRAHASAPGSTHNTGRPIAARPSRTATDDEILGLEDAHPPLAPNSSTLSSRQRADVWSDEGSAVGVRDDARADAADPSASPENRQQDAGDTQAAEPEALRATLDANPDLRRAWDDAQAYRATFATPEEARTATALLADLDRMDALFFSRRPEDHAELARAVAGLDPAAFASLAQAMAAQAAHAPRPSPSDSVVGAGLKPAPTAVNPSQAPSAPTQAQTEFFHATNAAAVEGVLEAIESQVERLLPEGISKSARNRVVGEIYRELDTTLRSNRQLAQQMREGFRSGALDADHQRALVSLVTGRARQQTAERRVDIADSGGTGSDGQRSMTPRDIDYRRMSDADILNL